MGTGNFEIHDVFTTNDDTFIAIFILVSSSIWSGWIVRFQTSIRFRIEFFKLPFLHLNFECPLFNFLRWISGQRGTSSIDHSSYPVCSRITRLLLLINWFIVHNCIVVAPPQSFVIPSSTWYCELGVGWLAPGFWGEKSIKSLLKNYYYLWLSGFGLKIAYQKRGKKYIFIIL